MPTLRRIVDILASLGYNQFQLYTEHTFAYSRHAPPSARRSGSSAWTRRPAVRSDTTTAFAPPSAVRVRRPSPRRRGGFVDPAVALFGIIRA